MKRTDIRAGVVYAVRNDRGKPNPVMFLEDRAAGIYSRRDRGGFHQQQENAYTKARRGSGWNQEAIGYAVIEQDWITAGTEPLAPPWAVDPAAELERFRGGGKPSLPGLKFDIMTGLGSIGPWDEAVAANEAREAAEREARARSDEGRARARAALDGIRALGIDAGLSFGSHKIELNIWEAEKLLAMLRDRED